MRQPALQTVERAFDLLSLFSPSVQEISVTEASRLLDLPLSSTHRLLVTLKRLGILEQNSAGGRYSMGTRLWELSCRGLKYADIREIARPFLQEIARETSETVVLATLDGADVLYLDRVVRSWDLSVLARIGVRRPAHCVSSGLAILAFSPNAIVESIIAKGLERLTPHSITDRATLWQELDRFRSLGYATNTDGNMVGISGVAAPILDDTKRAVAALAVAGPSIRLTPDIFPELGRLLRQKAGRIASLMGFCDQQMSEILSSMEGNQRALT